MPCYYIDKDGKSIHTWQSHLGGNIQLDDGRVLKEGEYKARVFVSHPEANPNLTRNDEGVWIYTGTDGAPRSMKEES
jgi:hypothetical protein